MAEHVLIGPTEEADPHWADEVIDGGGATLVSTLSVLASTETFTRTTRIERLVSEAGRKRMAQRREQAFAAIRSVRAVSAVRKTEGCCRRGRPARPRR